MLRVVAKQRLGSWGSMAGDMLRVKAMLVEVVWRQSLIFDAEERQDVLS